MNKLDKTEIQRKILHIMIGIIGLVLLMYEIVTPLIAFYILLAGIFLSLISLKIKIPIISYFLDNFEREKERKQFPGRGVIFGVAGAILVLKLFPKEIALASIIIMIFADPISHAIGKKFGKTSSFLDKRKNIEGNIAGFVLSSLLAMFFVAPCLAIAGALTAMLFESLIIEIQKIELDDNLIIPLAAGTAMYLIQIFLF